MRRRAGSGRSSANGASISARPCWRQSARRIRQKIALACGADHVFGYEGFAEKVAEITKGAKCAVVYDGVGKATFPASLDALRPFGIFASFGSASGPVEAFNLGILGQKGSLFATRPTLFSFLADRARLDTMARELFEVLAFGRGQDRHLRPGASGGGRAGASRPGGAAHHRLDSAGSLRAPWRSPNGPI